MSALSPWFLFLVVIATGLALRLIAGNLDRDRILESIESTGGKVLDISWNPLGPGWFGSQERIYDVRFKTRQGDIMTATCKTSMFSGVYWTGYASSSKAESGGTPGKPFFAEVEEPSTAPAEPIACLACGTRIPADQTNCAKCGWSYKGE